MTTLHALARITRPTRLAASLGLLWLAQGVMAQPVVPDAGRVLQEPPRPVQPLAPSVEFVIPAPTASETAPGGAQVLLTGLRLQGATRFSESSLAALLSDAIGRPWDLAGLRGLADRLSTHYRANGYPFARAYLPPQGMVGGVMTIEIIEGRYGAVRTTGEPALAGPAQAFLGRLQPGEVIEAAALERATLLIGDLPGVFAAPVLSPGEAVGTGDLAVELRAAPRASGQVAFDNHGNRYTGAYRLHGELAVNRLLRLGDELRLGLMATDEKLGFGHAAYALQLNADGLRGQLGLARTHYQLGKSFEALGARGDATVGSVGLSYPLQRSMASNLTLSATLQSKALRDRSRNPATHSDKRSNALPLVLQFDRRDALGTGGISYGSLAWTPGRLKLDAAARAGDAASLRSQGHFNKLNLDLNRLQNLPNGFSARARLAGQWSDKNLDSSEDFSLGGANGVRAYPQGEASGDHGWLAQLELRYAPGNQASLQPYAFHDAGEVRFNAKPWQGGDQHRSIAGTGLGLRYAPGDWQLDATLAWRTAGGPPTADTRDSHPRALVTAAKTF